MFWVPDSDAMLSASSSCVTRSQFQSVLVQRDQLVLLLLATWRAPATEASVHKDQYNES